MPSLHILKGPNEGTVIPLEGDRFVLGRNPDCAIVIPVTSVSREHAQILRVQGRYFIEDKQSRNHTFVNNQQISARTPLKNNDRIRICDFIAAYLDNPPADEEDDRGENDGPSTVEAMLSHTSHLLLETQPAEKLRTLLEISGNLNQTLDLDKLLPQIAESLFQLFRQADRCFLIQTTEGDRLMPRVVKARRAQDESTARFSRSIVRRCLESAQAFLSDDASRDDRIQLSQSVVDFRIRSVMCAPLCRADGKAFGVIQLDTQDRGKKFTQEDLKLLCGVANHAAISLENARLLEEAVKEERLKRDLKLAHDVQLSFLPQPPWPSLPGYELAAHYAAAQQVGGDYYGFIPLPGGRLAVCVGDVAGKGVSAALMMAKLSSDARFSLLTEADVARGVGKLNDLLYEVCSQADRFVTFAVVVVDPATHQLALVSAGHPSPVVYRPGAEELPEAMPKEAPGVPLGILEGFRFEASRASLGPGEGLVLFTDGVTDSMDVRDKTFDMKGVERAVGGAGRASAQGLVDAIVHGVRQHAAGREPHDDVTVVVLRREAVERTAEVG
jgi:serine phosphatase RsbU (regulator of sigma subunit)/pSer/pThr/pTyr-binding forkhead associated (FHA) protein